jgi:SM-20-related protein
MFCAPGKSAEPIAANYSTGEHHHIHFDFRPAMNPENIAEALEKSGYLILHKPLPDELLSRLRARCDARDPARFQTAHVGCGRGKKLMLSLRGDVISWLDETDDTDSEFLSAMGELRAGLNKQLYLGLFDYECHYAIYGAGAGYAKHLDVLHGKKNRILSTVLYLNEDWQPNDGGELDVYDETGAEIIATVTPKFGTMIIFLSEIFPHEVRIAHHTRRSIAGWFRVSGS